MLSLEGYIIGKSVINFSIFFGGRPPLPLKKTMQKNMTLFQGIKLNPQMILNTLNFTLTVTLFVYPFKTDVGYSVQLTVDGK